MKTLNEKGFIFRDVGAKLDYAVFHKDVEAGEKVLGWIRKYVVDREAERNETDRNR
jgi:hypothetical protein